MSAPMLTGIDLFEYLYLQEHSVLPAPLSGQPARHLFINNDPVVSTQCLHLGTSENIQHDVMYNADFNMCQRAAN